MERPVLENGTASAHSKSIADLAGLQFVTSAFHGHGRVAIDFKMNTSGKLKQMCKARKSFHPDRDLSSTQRFYFRHDLRMVAYHEAGHALVASKLGASSYPRVWLSWIKVIHPRKTKTGWFYGDTLSSFTSTVLRWPKPMRLRWFLRRRRSRLERAAIAWGGPIAHHRAEFGRCKELAETLAPWTPSGRELFVSWGDARQIGTDSTLSREGYELASKIIDINRDELGRIARKLMRLQRSKRMYKFMVPADPYARRARHWPPLRRTTRKWERVQADRKSIKNRRIRKPTENQNKHINKKDRD